MDVNKLVNEYTLDIGENIKKEFSAKYQYDILLAYFSSFKNVSDIVSDKNIEKSALMMVNYLATWGMYRASGNLRNTNTHFMEYILYSLMNKNDGSLLPLINKCFSSFTESDEYKIDKLLNELRTFIKFGGVTPTDTLVSKILLGVWGGIPAYDRFFLVGIREINKVSDVSITKSLSGRAILELSSWAKNFSWNNVSSSYDPECNIQYPFGKVVDMAIFQLGKNS